MSTGLLLGKFMPPHRGHQYLIDFARHYVDELTVHVCSIQAEPIPGDLRYRWVRDSFPMVRVVHNDDENPQEPPECPDRFWEIWRESLLRRMPRPPDYVFASEEYGFRLAEELGARYVPVDHNREMVPVSARYIREAPLRYWEYLLPAARPYYARRVALVGPESSGKSTLAPFLARHYGTVHVAEYGRTYTELMGLEIDEAAILNILRGHRAAEEAMVYQCRGLLFCDTDPLVTKVWSQHFLGYVPEQVERFVDEERYDLYLVLAATESWDDDGTRCHREYDDRRRFAEACIDELKRRGRPYVVLDGDWTERQWQAIAAVDALIARSGGGSDG